MTWVPRDPEPAPPTGAALRQLRDALGLRQRDLAFLLGVSDVSVLGWEREKVRPAPALARMLVWLAECIRRDFDAPARLSGLYLDPERFWASVLVQYLDAEQLDAERARR